MLDCLLLATLPALSGSVTAAAVFLLGAMLLAAAGRHLPVGVPETLFAFGLSGLLLLNTELTGTARAAVPLPAALAGLALLWALVHRWVERPQPGTAGSAAAPLRRATAALACTLAGLGVLAALVRDDLIATAPITLLVLVFAGVLLYASTRAALARDAVLAVLLFASWHAVADRAPTPRPYLVNAGLLAASLAALASVLAAVLANWRRRVRIWQTDPQRLVSPPPAYRIAYDVTLALAIGVGWGALLTPGVWFTPFAVFCAALAVFTVGHLRSSATIGRIGLALTGEALVLAATGWLPSTPAAPVLGGAVAGVYLLWLARFWTQQLHAGQAWTTAGRLIPAARELSYAAAALACIAACAWRAAPEAWAQPGYAQAIVGGALLLLLMSMLFRDAVAQASPVAAIAGWLALLAAGICAAAVLLRLGVDLSPVGVLGAVALLGALRTRIGLTAAGPHWPHNAWIGALVPVAVCAALLLTGATRRPDSLFALVCAAGALLVRFSAPFSWSAPQRTG